METVRAHHLVSGPFKRPQRPSSARSTASLGRHSLDFANRRSLERPAPTIPAVPNLPPAIPAMGPAGCFPAHCPGAGTGPIRTRRHRYPRSLYRRNLCSGKKRGLAVGKTKRGKGTKIMAIADASGVPVAADVASASPHEVTLVDATIDSGFVEHAPDRLIGDKAYDSDGLDERLARTRGVEMIAPHRRNRRKTKTQDGRSLRRYRRRWKVERLFAWLQNFRRLTVRWEYHVDNFLGMLLLGCIKILLRFF